MIKAIETIGLSKRYRIGEEPGLADLAGWLWRSVGRQPCSSALYINALDDVSFSMVPGDLVGLIGANGAGKSTLLRILSRITSPSSGQAQIRGRVVSLLDVTAGFHTDLTGLENIYFAAAIMGMAKKEIRAKLDSIVAMAQIERFLTTPVKRYSSGMFLRLGIAIAAHLDADVLLFDEVLAAADDAFQQRCYALLRQSTQSGCAVIFVSHQLEAIERLCPRTLLLDQGRLIVDGPTSGVIPVYRALLEPKSLNIAKVEIE